MYHNSIDITTFDGYILRIDCNKAEKGLKNTAWTDHVLNALAIDNLLETCNPSDTDGFVLSQQRNTDIYRGRGYSGLFDIKMLTIFFKLLVSIFHFAF